MTLSQYITSDARQNIKDIGQYLEERNPAAARRATNGKNYTLPISAVQDGYWSRKKGHLTTCVV